jgi:hypothetical protein
VGVVQAETGELICNALFDGGEEYPNAEANTRLIAAAPNLLAALELAMIVISQHYPEQEDCCKDRIEVVRRAIAEVKGKV